MGRFVEEYEEVFGNKMIQLSDNTHSIKTIVSLIHMKSYQAA